jgi:hypothetical protein
LKHSTVEVGTDARGRYRVRCPQVEREHDAPPAPGYRHIGNAWESMRHKYPLAIECGACVHGRRPWWSNVPGPGEDCKKQGCAKAGEISLDSTKADG